MNLVVTLLLIVLVLVAVAVLTVAIAYLWFRRGQRRAVKHFGDATRLIRRRGDDPRFTRKLAALADDPRTPDSAHTWLLRLVRYRHEPVVLAPEWVPVLGWLDEVTIESFLLRQTWRSLPPDLWAEYFPADTPRPVVERRAPEAVPAGQAEAVGLAALLAELERDGRYDDLLRTLDRRLPPWPIGTALIDVARELVELDRNLAAARVRGVPEAVTTRLAGESARAAGALWDLADRLVVTASFGVEMDGLQARLANEQDRLVELRGAMREARTGLAELTLAGAVGRDSLDRAERRFRALARTADELQQLDA
jgi:uncharacterized membrane protein YkvA (DUF1232 family)